MSRAKECDIESPLYSPCGYKGPLSPVEAVSHLQKPLPLDAALRQEDAGTFQRLVQKTMSQKLYF